MNECDTFGSRQTNGYCSRCFAHRFPHDKRARFVRSKELAVNRFLLESFPNLTWSFNKCIEGGCSRRRPDAFAHLGTHAITVETDENEHIGDSYSCACENRKMMEHFRDAGEIPHVFVRFNPDAYIDSAGEKHKSCWEKTPLTMEPRVALRRQKAWKERLETLRLTIEQSVQNTPSREVELKLLYYTGYELKARSPACATSEI